MTIEILQRGTPPSERKMAGTCMKCSTRIKCSCADAKYEYDQRDGIYYTVTCPVCSHVMYVDFIKFDDGGK